LAERGWIAPHWPKEYGGAGLTPMEQFIFKQEMAQAQAPAVGGMGVSLLGPTLIVHGTEEQRAEHLPRILSGEVAWAEGYSEPGAGSDLASLQARAIRDGDEYVINGQKIWTSGAHTADWLFALVRTDPEAPKHRGISFLMMDRNTPGITVRPLINMGWTHGFNETFVEDVHVPAKHLVGDENVINGQKIWTSGAHTADWLFALVRTDPEAPKHRGISFLMMDRNTPGITVRPLINMGWTHGFNETFFEDVHVPAKNLVGE